jgi:hypothetical protein
MSGTNEERTKMKVLQEQMDRHMVEMAAVALEAVIDCLGLDLTPEQYLEALLEIARRETTTSQVSPTYPDLFEQAVETFVRERNEERDGLA